MEYKKIIAVTGLPGLYELINSKSDGAIVRSLEDKSTRFVSSRIHNFSHLESIEVYTVRDNVNLVDVLKAMEGSSEKMPDEKDNAALKVYFTRVYPDLDFDRVYSSDLKKMVKWFSVLKSNQIEIKLSEPEPEPEEKEPEERDVVEKAPAKKEKPKAAAPAKPAAKAEPVKEEAKTKKTATEKPKTKSSAAKEEPKTKKAAATDKAAPKKKTAEKAPSKTAKKSAPKKKK